MENNIYDSKTFSILFEKDCYDNSNIINLLCKSCQKSFNIYKISFIVNNHSHVIIDNINDLKNCKLKEFYCIFCGTKHIIG